MMTDLDTKSLDALLAEIGETTPAPWHVAERGFSRRGLWSAPTVYFTDNELRYVAVCACADELNFGRPTDNLANARLIALAPEMRARIAADAKRIERDKKAIRKLERKIEQLEAQQKTDATEAIIIETRMAADAWRIRVLEKALEECARSYVANMIFAHLYPSEKGVASLKRVVELIQKSESTDRIQRALYNWEAHLAPTCDDNSIAADAKRLSAW